MPRCNREGPGKHYDVRMPDWSEIHGRFSKHPWATVCLFLQAKTACTSKFIRHWRWWLTLPACIRQLHTFTTPRLTIHKSIRRWFVIPFKAAEIDRPKHIVVQHFRRGLIIRCCHGYLKRVGHPVMPESDRERNDASYWEHKSWCVNLGNASIFVQADPNSRHIFPVRSGNWL